MAHLPDVVVICCVRGWGRLAEHLETYVPGKASLAAYTQRKCKHAKNNGLKASAGKG